MRQSTLRQPLHLDVFGASVVRILDGEFDKSGNGNRLPARMRQRRSWCRSASLEPYVFWRRDVNMPTETGIARRLSVRPRWRAMAGRLPATLDYSVEMAAQRGSLGDRRCQRMGGPLAVARVAAGRRRRTSHRRIQLCVRRRRPRDGIRGTFDQLYPTPHDKYGLADQVGWKNIHHLRAGVEFTPVQGPAGHGQLPLVVAGPERDGLYTAGGAPLARVASGAASRTSDRSSTSRWPAR